MIDVWFVKGIIGSVHRPPLTSQIEIGVIVVTVCLNILIAESLS